MRFNKAYIEITNICNLSCPFCHGTSREKRFMSVDEFETAAARLRPFTEYVYLHIMGEPLLHPQLFELLDICEKYGFKTSLTTNGTLLYKMADQLTAKKALYRICVSLHSFEPNGGKDSSEYVGGICNAALKARENGVLFSMRLWNNGGANSQNSAIIKQIEEFFPLPHRKNRSGETLADGIFLEYGDVFVWPDSDGEQKNVRFCKGLRDQIGVLCDGTVVPCCLDAEGDIALGNIFSDLPENIFSSERATRLVNGFSEGRAEEKLCRTCGFAENRFGAKHGT